MDGCVETHSCESPTRSNIGRSVLFHSRKIVAFGAIRPGCSPSSRMLPLMIPALRFHSLGSSTVILSAKLLITVTP